MPCIASEPFSIAIIGGGLGGLCLAVGLIRRGISVQIYEQAPRFSEIGRGIAFGPNSIKAMELIDPAIAEAFRKLATHNEESNHEDVYRTWINFRSGHGEAEMIAKVQTCDEMFTGLSSVHRATFMDELAKLIPHGVAHFRKRLSGIEKLPNGQLEILFEDGTYTRCDTLLGADGIRSRTRQIMSNMQTPYEDLSFANTAAYRAMVPMKKAIAAIGKEYATNANMYIAPGGHVLTYPVDHGENMNVVAFVHMDDWAYPASVVKDPDLNEMKKRFDGWCDPVQKTIEIMTDIDFWALYDLNHLSTFYQSNIALLGDAAHASTPHQGAGAGQAIEDAFIMSELLANVALQRPQDIIPAFKAYDAIRRARSQKVVSTSRAAGEIYKFTSHLGDDIEKIRHDILARHNWIWNEDMQVQAERAKAMLDGITGSETDDAVKPKAPEFLAVL